MTRSVLGYAYLGASWLFVGCVVVQVFLAGLGVFRGPADWDVHRSFAFLFGWLTLVLLVLGIAGRSRRRIGTAILLMVLFSLQSVFVELRTSQPELAALHPVNGFLILLVGIVAAREAWHNRPGTISQAAAG